MRVFHFILGKANKDRANGVNQVIAGLAKYSARLGAEVRVIGKAETVRYEGEEVPRDSFSVEAYSRWSRALARAVWEAVKWADIVHLHGSYSPANIAVSKICDYLERPYVVTLHNGLSPQLSRLRKIAFHKAVQRRHIARAAAIHVLTEEEATDVLTCSRPKQILCVPNGIDLDDFPVRPSPPRGVRNKIVLAYLGRLSPEKNLDALCEAFAHANVAGKMRLRLAGPLTAYGSNLLRQYACHGVELVGAKFGQDKVDFIKAADLFVHPSRCDVFSIGAMEVLAVGTPLLITRTSNAPYYFDRQAFFMCEPTTFGLRRGISLAIEKASSWVQFVDNGRKLVEEKLNWAVSAESLLNGYEQILSGRK